MKVSTHENIQNENQGFYTQKTYTTKMKVSTRRKRTQLKRGILQVENIQNENEGLYTYKSHKTKMMDSTSGKHTKRK